MNVQHAPRASTESREPYRYARLHGRWLLLARVGWVALVVLTLAIFFASLPVYRALLQTPCAGAACEWQQLTPGQVETLRAIGLSLSDYAASTVALRLVSVVLYLVVSTLIVWRRSDDRMALLVALLLVTSGPILTSSVVPYFPPPGRCRTNACSSSVLPCSCSSSRCFPVGSSCPASRAGSSSCFLLGKSLSPSSPSRL